MKVIIIVDLPAQRWKKDDVRDVAAGFAQNFLFPKKLAVPATAAVLEQVKYRAATRQKSEQQSRSLLHKSAEKLRALKVEFTAKAHEGKLFGGIGAPQILAELKKHGIVLESKQIKLEHPLKTVGEHSVKVHLGETVETEIKVRIDAEGNS